MALTYLKDPHRAPRGILGHSRGILRTYLPRSLFGRRNMDSDEDTVFTDLFC
jgi:hypothetical protein